MAPSDPRQSLSEPETLQITDPYERRAWEAYQEWVEQGRELGAIGRGVRSVTRTASGIGGSVRDRLDGTTVGEVVARAGATARGVWTSDGVQAVVEATQAAVDSGYTTAIDASLRSVDPTDALEHYSGFVVGERIEELRELPLRVLDRRRPPMEAREQLRFAATSAATGTVQGLASVTGVVSASVVAADIVASIGLSARAIAVQLSHYGYDVTQPSEHAYVLTLMQASLAESTVEQALLTSQARWLSHGLARGRSWSQLDEQLLGRLAQRAFRTVGERLTRQRLARLVPGVAGLVGAGQGYRHGRMIVDAAFHEGRARLLRDRWGDGDEVLPAPDDPGA